MSERTCSIDDCSRPLKSRGWCNTHYERWRLTGSVDLVEREPRICELDGCGELHYSLGMCKPHYRQDYYRRNGDHERATMAQWRTENRAYDRERWATWFAEHADELAARKRETRAADLPGALEREARYRDANRQAIYAAAKAWREANPARWALRNRENQRRRRRIDGRPVDYAVILAEHGMHCHICEQPIAGLADLHFDHVIPLALGGPHHEDNIRPAHARCNLRKGAKLLV